MSNKLQSDSLYYSIPAKNYAKFLFPPVVEVSQWSCATVDVVDVELQMMRWIRNGLICVSILGYEAVCEALLD
jgi:hypothetical protein